MADAVKKLKKSSSFLTPKNSFLIERKMSMSAGKFDPAGSGQGIKSRSFTVDKRTVVRILKDEMVVIEALMSQGISRDEATKEFFNNHDEKIYNPLAIYLAPGEEIDGDDEITAALQAVRSQSPTSEKKKHKEVTPKPKNEEEKQIAMRLKDAENGKSLLRSHSFRSSKDNSPADVKLSLEAPKENGSSKKQINANDQRQSKDLSTTPKGSTNQEQNQSPRDHSSSDDRRHTGRGPPHTPNHDPHSIDPHWHSNKVHSPSQERHHSNIELRHDFDSPSGYRHHHRDHPSLEERRQSSNRDLRHPPRDQREHSRGRYNSPGDHPYPEERHHSSSRESRHQPSRESRGDYDEYSTSRRHRDPYQDHSPGDRRHSSREHHRSSHDLRSHEGGMDRRISQREYRSFSDLHQVSNEGRHSNRKPYNRTSPSGTERHTPPSHHRYSSPRDHEDYDREYEREHLPAKPRKSAEKLLFENIRGSMASASPTDPYKDEELSYVGSEYRRSGGPNYRREPPKYQRDSPSQRGYQGSESSYRQSLVRHYSQQMMHKSPQSRPDEDMDYISPSSHNRRSTPQRTPPIRDEPSSRAETIRPQFLRTPSADSQELRNLQSRSNDSLIPLGKDPDEVALELAMKLSIEESKRRRDYVEDIKEEGGGPLEFDDDQILELGTLLGVQKSQYGVNMYEALEESDEPILQQFQRLGMTQEESVLRLFESKFGKVTVPLNNLSREWSSSRNNSQNNVLSPDVQIPTRHDSKVSNHNTSAQSNSNYGKRTVEEPTGPTNNNTLASNSGDYGGQQVFSYLSRSHSGNSFYNTSPAASPSGVQARPQNQQSPPGSHPYMMPMDNHQQCPQYAPPPPPAAYQQPPPQYYQPPPQIYPNQMPQGYYGQQYPPPVGYPQPVYQDPRAAGGLSASDANEIKGIMSLGYTREQATEVVMKSKTQC